MTLLNTKLEWMDVSEFYYCYVNVKSYDHRKQYLYMQNILIGNGIANIFYILVFMAWGFLEYFFWT